MRNGRRQFLMTFATATAAVTAPALAQTTPDIEWKITSSFTPALDLIWGGGEIMAKALAELTDGHFTLKILPAGEIVPAGEALEAVSSGKADGAHTALAYAWSEDPSFIFGSSASFRDERPPA